MDLATLGLNTFIILLIALVIVCLAALFEQEIREVLRNLFTLFLRPLHLLRRYITHVS